MKSEDFDRLKAVCKKEGFEVITESHDENDKFFVVRPKKDEQENPRFLAICTTPTGKSFRYEDNAKDMICFLQYIKCLYPDFEIESVTSLSL